MKRRKSVAQRIGSATTSGLFLLASMAVQSGCAHRAVSTTASHVPTAKIAAVPAAPGRLTAPPFGPGIADTDRPASVQPRGTPDPEPTQKTAAAPLTTSNVRLTQIGGWWEAETTIAVNPTNPLNLVAGARTSPTPFSADRFYSSSDGGQSWTEGILPVPSGFSFAADPVVAFCGDGSAYYAMLAETWATGSNTKSAIFVHRSTDGGLTWPTRTTVVDRVSEAIAVSDKPWMTCDTTGSPFSGRIYVEYTDPLLVPSGSCTAPYCRVVKVCRSTDHGATWSAPVMVSANPQNPQNQGALAVGPSGELYVAWDHVVSGGDTFGSIKVDKSTNGGVSFGTDIVATSFTGIRYDDYFGRLTYPTMDVDRTHGPYRGYVYIAFSDGRNGDPDILLVLSTDGGTTWSPPVRVNDDLLHNGADQWAPGLAVDPRGRIIVTFSDRRRYVGEERYEQWGAISRDGGLSFDTNFLIGDTPSDVGGPVFLGDYDGVAVTSDHLYPLWADLRNSPIDSPDPDIYTDRFRNMFAYDEIRGVFWSDADDMGFNSQDARFGVDLDYDVVGGLLSELRTDRAFGRAACVAPLWPAPPLVDVRVPPADDGYYYLARAHGPGGVGTYGDAAPPARPNLRDPLDETLLTCP